MHEPLLAQAALPAPTKILGLTMRPYSLGHELFLIREGNPIIFGNGSESRPQDVAEAALICCQSFEECKRMSSDWLLGIKLAIWMRRVRNADHLLARAAFVEYRKAGSLEFPLSDIVKPGRESSGRIPGAPFLLRLNQFLMTKFGMSESQAWDYPLGLAKMRWETYWEAESGLDIYNEHDSEFDRFVAEQEAKGKEALKHG